MSVPIEWEARWLRNVWTFSRREESPAFAGNRTRSVVTLPTTLLRNYLMTACQPHEFETRPNQFVELLQARAICEGRSNCPTNSTQPYQKINSSSST